MYGLNITGNDGIYYALSFTGISKLSSTSACPGRGSVLQATAVHNERRQMNMRNAQKPYEQYLVIVCCLFALKLMFKFKNLLLNICRNCIVFICKCKL